MDGSDLIYLLRIASALANPSDREDASRRLAQFLDVEHTIIFIADPELGTLVPAPGFPQTLPGRRAWRRFIDECGNELCSAQVNFPDRHTVMQAHGVRGADGTVLVLLNGVPHRERAEQARLCLPLLTAALRGEQVSKMATAQEKLAQETVAQANSIAQALDATRIELQAELVERRRAEEELQGLNEHLEQRVAERTNDLERAVEELEYRNRELQDFAHVASHDLQEPLRKVRTFSGLLIADFRDHLDERGRYYLDAIDIAATRMAALITALLDFSRVVTRGNPYQRVALGEVVKGVLSDLQIRIFETGARVEVGELPVLEADPIQMRQLFLNLIGNALKFHRKGMSPVVQIRGTVDSDCGPGRQGGQVVRIVVEDNGIGFEENFAERIFAPFQRLHTQDMYEGTGIGLAVCRRIVERHGGRMEVESTPGTGSSFFVYLPVHRKASASRERAQTSK